MSKIDHEYGELCFKILNSGRDYINKNREVTRRQIPSYTLRHSFDDGFPLLTTKEVNMNSVIVELLWFLKGDNDIKYLLKHGVNIWNKDAYNWYVKNFKETKGNQTTFDWAPAEMLTYKEFVKRKS